MKDFSYVIKDKLGIHARPAGLLVKETSKFACKIIIKKDATEKDAKSILGVMGLGAKNGDKVVITFDGTDEAAALETIRNFFINYL